MAKIPLRAYNREIENLIDSGHSEEAIAHCRHILRAFPKHVETYRLLGKAFLETQRYSDASDILQRVLSSTPDDFVSHVGMSIIREDEGNLDQAIWHMERAFEIQPANGAIQEELRRLYGRRDGFEPPRVRLTRGALARMYVRGDLYQQAIGELREALKEDPQRIDLQVLLSEAYAKAGHRAEAAEISSAVLKKLPYCIGALSTMSMILSATERSEETQVYRQRLGVLDPYMLHAGPQASSADRVLENAVTLEHMDWKPGEAETNRAGQPEWAASLGIKLESSSEKEALPDWMNVGSQPQESEEDAWSAAVARGTGFLRMDQRGEQSSPRSEEPDETPDWIADAAAPAEPTPDEQIPDWMKDAGWGPSTGAFQEEPMSFDQDGEGSAAEEDASGAEMPDWLREMAPNLSDEQPESDADNEENFDWLTPPVSAAQTSEVSAGELPDWMEEQETAGPPQAAEMPDWLKEFSPQEAADELASGTEAAQPEIPDWLTDLTSPVDETQALPTPMDATVPSWLQALGNEETVTTPVDEETAAQAETIPSWMHGLGDSEAAEDQLQDESAASAETIPSWLQGLGALDDGHHPGEALAPKDQEGEQPEAVPGDLPDWMAELEPAETAPEEAGAEPAELPDWMAESVSPAGPALEEEMEAAPAEDLPAWLVDEEQAPEFEDISGEQSGEAIPLWMAGLTGQESPEAELITGEEQALAPEDAEAPTWLLEEEVLSQDDTQPVRVQREVEVETSQAKVEPAQDAAQPTGMDMDDMDAAFAWLESLAVKQGASEALLLTPEERSEKAPDWVEDLAERPGADPLEERSEDLSAPGPQAFSAQEDLVPVAEAEGEVEDQGWFLPEDARAIEEALDLESAIADQPERQAEATSVPASEAFELPGWLMDEDLPATMDDTLPFASQPEYEPSEAEGGAAFEYESEQPEALVEEQLQVEQDEAGGAFVIEHLEAEQTEGIEAREDEQPELEPAEPAGVTGFEQLEAAEPAAAPAGEMDLNDMDAAFAWLESLAVKQGAHEALLLTPEQRRETAPDWVEGMTNDAAAADFEESTSTEEPASLEESTVIEEFALDQPEPVLADEDLPHETVFSGAETLVSRPEGLDEELAEAEIPAWLVEDEQSAPLLEGDTKPVRRAAPEAEAQPAPGAEGEQEDDFAWMESPAVDQDASEALLTPEEQLERTPEWVEDFEETSIEPHANIEEQPVGQAQLEEIPDWLSDLEVGEQETPSEQAVRALSTERTGSDQLEDWLDEVPTASTEQLPLEPVTEQVTSPEPSASADLPELPDWLAGVDSSEKLDWTPPPVQEKLVRKLDLNLASLAELERLPGVGFRMAQAIVNYRETYGAFKKVSDLFDVRGFSQATMDFIDDRVYVETPPEPEQQTPREGAWTQLGGVSGSELPGMEGEAPAELVKARDALLNGNVEESIGHYDQLIRARQNLPFIILDLQSAVQRNPTEVLLWQALGDAHMRMDQLQDALNAYMKAEDLLR